MNSADNSQKVPGTFWRQKETKRYPVPFDAVLLIGFGAPEREEDIVPFLKGIFEGREKSKGARHPKGPSPFPQARFDQVLENYRLIGNRSPYNELSEKQAAALRQWLQENQINIPVFLGMRNWHPYLSKVIGQVKEADCRRALGIVLAPHRSPASFDRYLASVEEAKRQAGYKNLKIDYAPAWHTHPLFIQAVSGRIQESLKKIDPGKNTEFIFTAHSLPVAMARQGSYEKQIRQTARAVMKNFPGIQWHIAYQSRSGNPADPWLGPDINELARRRANWGVKALMIIPVGFLCDHVEVLYDLDIVARQNAAACGIHFERALTVMDHPKFIAMLGELVKARHCEPGAQSRGEAISEPRLPRRLFRHKEGGSVLWRTAPSQ